jgi:chemotaxis protein methyltransferase CheR
LDFLKKWFVLQQKSMRIWSVGSGLGYEPYSISCCFSEVLHSFSLNSLPSLEIIGSDMSSQALNFSNKAIYAKDSYEKSVSWLRKRKFFQKPVGMSGGFYELKFPEKERVSFIEQDILKNLHPLGFFDIIFCTQILPYFSKNLRYAVACRLSDRLTPGGYMFLGDVDIDFKDLPDMRKVVIDKWFLYQKMPL